MHFINIKKKKKKASKEEESVSVDRIKNGAISRLFYEMIIK